MNILGISAFYHDSAAALIKDGEIVAAAQEERFTRKKHDASFPTNAVSYCLNAGGITTKELDFVAFYEKPFLKFERLLKSYLEYSPSGIKSFLKSMPIWVKEKIWMKDYLATELNYNGEFIFPQHHESHAASAFFPSPYREAAILTMDGVGEWTTSSFGIGTNNKIKILSEIRFPDSLGLLYSAFTYYTGFKVNSGEYKLMGLAPYGEPRYKDLILKELVDVKEDGSLKMNMSYFNYCVGLTMTNERFNQLFGGPPRKPESPITQKDMDLASSIQVVTEDIMLKMAKHVRKTTGMKNLCLAGGVALNCVGNGRIHRESGFEDIWIQPAAGDAGGALGAAQFVWYQYLNNERKANNQNDSIAGAYLGPEFSDQQIRSFLEENNVEFNEVSSDEKIAEKVANLIAEGNVIGWFQGRMEFGPRALGARSILGDPRSPDMQQKINLKIKFRESFRPFAPSIMKEKIANFFDSKINNSYMLIVAPVKSAVRRELSSEEKKLSGLEKLKVVRSSIPAVTHVDYSARVQTVDREAHPLYYRLLESFDKKYGCPVIINTSFNVRGEPIVNTPKEAFDCFMKTEMDYLVIGHFIISKKDQNLIRNSGEKTRSFQKV